MSLYLILSYLPSLICGVHVVRSGRQMTWLWFFMLAPLLAPAIYVLAELAPEWFSGRTAGRLRAGVRRALDPEREYRQAKEAVYETPSAGARLRFGHAAMAMKKYEEAEGQFRQAAQGQFADDPAILMAHALALLELNRWQDALERLELLRAQGAPGQTAQAALAFARAFEGLGRFDEADGPYRFAADRSPGLEAAARYVAFMAKAGRKDDARIGLEELDRRYKRIPSHFKAEAKTWRDFAAAAIG